MSSSLATPWTAAHQAPLSMGFPRQEYWSGLPFPSPGDLSHPGIEPMSPALAGEFFTTEPSGKPLQHLLEWPKSKTLAIPNAGRDLEPQERSYIAGRNAKWYSHFQRQVANCLKSKHAFTLLGVYPNELKTDVNTKNLHYRFFF